MVKENQGKVKRRKQLGCLVKGFSDYIGENAIKRAKIKKIIEKTFSLYGFEPVETPIIEYEEFVKGDNQNDEAVSDVFKLEDKGKRKLALRYELTFQLKRIANNKKLPYKRYSIGEAFRDEPITGNRARQFTSCDVDMVGSTIKNEAEILKLISEILNKLKIKFTININNRKLLNEILDEKGIKDKDKQIIIKEIDKLDKLSESEVKANLKKYNADSLISIFKKPEPYFKKYNSYKEIEELKKYCNIYKIKLNFQPSLARGLAYYTGTVFEIKSDIKETVCGGGSYLINKIQSFGFGVSLERLEILAKIQEDNKQILIISLNQDKKAIELTDKIRKLNIPCSIMYGKVSKALDYANSYGIPYIIFLGDEEVKKRKIKIKNMKTGKEKMIDVKNLEKELKIYNLDNLS